MQSSVVGTREEDQSPTLRGQGLEESSTTNKEITRNLEGCLGGGSEPGMQSCSDTRVSEGGQSGRGNKKPRILSLPPGRVGQWL